MPSKRVQRPIERLLDRAEEAADHRHWELVSDLCDQVLRLDPANEDAKTFLEAAGRDTGVGLDQPEQEAPTKAVAVQPAASLPSSFADGRYEVKRLLGESGRKRVYLAHDPILDRDVAFALIKTESLDKSRRARVSREARTLGRLGAHPNVVTVFDLGEHEDQPFMVTEFMDGGDVARLIEEAPDRRLSLERVAAIATAVCRGGDVLPVRRRRSQKRLLPRL